MPQAAPTPAPTMVLRIAVPSPLRRSFDYLLPPDMDEKVALALPAGVRVRIPFGRRTLVGVLLEVSSQTDVDPSRLRPAMEVLDSVPLIPEHLLALCQWAAAYYQHPVGEVLHSLMPVALRQGKVAEVRAHHSDKSDLVDGPDTLETPLTLNREQAQAVSAITAQPDQYRCFLLDGITGSGKTEVYLQCMEHTLARSGQVLVLVPEISLTPQTITRFRQRFDCTLAVLHSGLTDRQRLNAWLRASNGEARIIIGTRSAVFTPMQRPGLIIIDEEHDNSFKQQEGFRYSARDLAVMRAQREQIPIVLGTATPSLESLNNAGQGRYSHLRLTRRAGSSKSPRFHLLDVSGQALQEGFAPAMIDSIRKHLERNSQVLVFINRRGFAPVLQCNDCGWIAECHHCDARLTIHKSPAHLRCHHCDRPQAINRHCPDCQSSSLSALGLGTERSESHLRHLFPDTRVIRVDRDSTRRKNELDRMLLEVNRGEPCILVGTQMLAKGHHFPAVTLVAVLDADSGLFSADFRGQEHMAQLLIQVAGRAGREDRPGEVIVQTRHATHQALITLTTEGYHSFANWLLTERSVTAMPPFTHLALIRAEAVSTTAPMKFLQQVRQTIETAARQSATLRSVEIMGPLPAPMEKRAGRFRAQLMLKAPERTPLQQLLGWTCQQLESDNSSRHVRWSVDVDPQDML